MQCLTVLHWVSCVVAMAFFCWLILHTGTWQSTVMAKCVAALLLWLFLHLTAFC
jgi:hypothetical protein